MATLDEIVKYTNTLLDIQSYHDASLNGLQVGTPKKPAARQTQVCKIATAVDCGQTVIEAAIREGAEILIVHHGLFWGKQEPLTGPLMEKIELLLRNGCALYASHLPLDGDMEFGNAAQIAKRLELSNLEPFCLYSGSHIGIKGRLSTPTSITELNDKISAITNFNGNLVLPFGATQIRSIGIVTGSGAFAIPPAKTEGLDLLLSGEPKQEAYHTALDLKQSVIFAGHYATETFGVRALGEHLAKHFKVSVHHIDLPTGI